jgi:hypothetical protein
MLPARNHNQVHYAEFGQRQQQPETCLEEFRLQQLPTDNWHSDQRRICSLPNFVNTEACWPL